MSCMRALDSTPTPRRSPPIYLLFCSLFNFPHTTTSLSSAFSSFCTTTSSITAPSALTRFILFCIFQVPRTAPCCGLLLRFFFFSARFFFDCLRRLWRFGLYSPAHLQLHRLCVAFFFSASVAAACAGCGVSAYIAPLVCNCMPLRCFTLDIFAVSCSVGQRSCSPGVLVTFHACQGHAPALHYSWLHPFFHQFTCCSPASDWRRIS
jgi:hypothetical protein